MIDVPDFEREAEEEEQETTKLTHERTRTYAHARTRTHTHAFTSTYKHFEHTVTDTNLQTRAEEKRERV